MGFFKAIMRFSMQKRIKKKSYASKLVHSTTKPFDSIFIKWNSFKQLYFVVFPSTCLKKYAFPAAKYLPQTGYMDITLPCTRTTSLSRRHFCSTYWWKVSRSIHCWWQLTNPLPGWQWSTRIKFILTFYSVRYASPND